MAKRQTARDFCRFSEANSGSIEVYVSIARFQPLGYYSGALQSEPSQNSPYLHAFSPLLRSEGRNIEMEASSGRVWLQIFRNNRIGLYAMVPRFSSDATVTHLPRNPRVHSPSLTCRYRCSICTVQLPRNFISFFLDHSGIITSVN